MVITWVMSGGSPTMQRVAENIVYCPPQRTVAFAVTVPETKGLVRAAFEVLSNKSGVRLLLYGPTEYQKLKEKRLNHSLAATEYEREGRVEARVSGGTRWWLVIDNRLEGRSTAEVKVWADFASGAGVVEGKGPEPGRARALMAGAFGFSGFCILLLGVGLYANGRPTERRR